LALAHAAAAACRLEPAGTWAAVSAAIEVFRVAAVASGIGMLAVSSGRDHGIVPARDAGLFIEGVKALDSGGAGER
ncbi:MAG: hypothetical protein N3A38_13350, partial [Planctomycetota bacterium]|nr:hypothetical protein [Planctomycetota bacterium]